MKLAESLEILYKISNEVMGQGPIEAKQFVVGEVFNAISDLQDQNLPVTAEAIEKLVGQIAQDFKEVAESKVASTAAARSTSASSARTSPSSQPHPGKQSAF